MYVIFLLKVHKSNCKSYALMHFDFQGRGGMKNHPFCCRIMLMCTWFNNVWRYIELIRMNFYEILLLITDVNMNANKTEYWICNLITNKLCRSLCTWQVYQITISCCLDFCLNYKFTRSRVICSWTTILCLKFHTFYNGLLIIVKNLHTSKERNYLYKSHE